MVIDQRTMRLVQEIEQKMDEYNGALGDAGTLCLFCHAKLYNGKVGIIHKEDCIIIKLREFILNNGATLLS